MIERAAVTSTADGLHVQGIMDGTDARDVNRRLLSALRQAEKKTRLRAEWTGEGYVHRFFDYVSKSTRPVAYLKKARATSSPSTSVDLYEQEIISVRDRMARMHES